MELIEQYNKAIEESPLNFDLYRKRAIKKLALNDYHGAVLDCNIAIALVADAKLTKQFKGEALEKIKERVIDGLRRKAIDELIRSEVVPEPTLEQFGLIEKHLLLLKKGQFKIAILSNFFELLKGLYFGRNYKKTRTQYANYLNAIKKSEEEVAEWCAELNDLHIEEGKKLAYKILEQERIKVEDLKKQKENIKSHKEYWLNLDGLKFEQEVGCIFQECGFTDVIVTPASGDYGVDIRMNKNGLKYIVQCKNWKAPIPPKEVMQLYGALVHERANRAIFIASSGFSANAIQFAKGKPIDFLDIDIFLNVVNSKEYISYSPESLRSIARGKKSNQHEAYQRYLRGKEYWNNRFS